MMPSQMMTYEWFKCFKNGRTLMDDNERSGQPSTSRSEPLIAQVKTLSVEIASPTSCRGGWNQTTILTLEESCFVLLQESTTGVLKSESNAACFSRPLRHCAL
jgi:hypothetical protein